MEIQNFSRPFFVWTKEPWSSKLQRWVGADVLFPPYDFNFIKDMLLILLFSTVFNGGLLEVFYSILKQFLGPLNQKEKTNLKPYLWEIDL